MSNTKPNFKEIYTNEFDAELCEGYYDGRRPDSPEPGSNRHPAYIHGFMNGRDDIECFMKVRRFPRRTAQQTRDALKMIEAMLK